MKWMKNSIRISSNHITTAEQGAVPDRLQSARFLLPSGGGLAC